MKGISFLSLLLFVTLECFSQKDEEAANISDYTVNYISLTASPRKLTTAMAVSGIAVFDIRFDSSSLGVYKNPNTYRLILLKLKKGLQDEARLFFSSLIQTNGSDTSAVTLYCYIKKLFLSDNITVSLKEDNRTGSNKNDTEEKSGIVFQAEFYLKQQNMLTPFYRFDSTIVGDKATGKSGDYYISEALTASLQKSQILNWKKTLQQGRKLSEEEVTDYNKQRTNIPLLTKGYSKGIYLSFNDFKNNKPATTEFIVEKGSTGDFLYIKNQKGEDALLTDLWGYSDGKDAYIFSANNYFKLHPSGNGFVIYGAKDYTSKRTLRLNFGLIDAIAPNSNYAKTKTANSYSLIKNYFQLDMETGELY